MNWIHKNEIYAGPTDVKEQYGFVYKITNAETGKFYIGAKFFWKPHYKMVNKKRKKSMIESDWRDYWSSSEKLKKDVLELGESNFTREILHIVKYRGMVKYLETKEIISRNCLELSDDECYNGIVACKIHKRCVRV